MNQQELKLYSLGIDKEKFGKIYTTVDFGNVNHWYDKDRRDWDNNDLNDNQKLIIDIQKLSSFIDLFSEQKRFYYGWHKRIKSSWHILIEAENKGFIKCTKEIQYIKHYIDDIELASSSRTIIEDADGKYIKIPKSNFDVEISIDAIRLIERYDTFCLLSGDSDFTRLINFLGKKGKKIIIIASGQIFHTLKEQAEKYGIYINAQKIKGSIATIKTTQIETPPIK